MLRPAVAFLAAALCAGAALATDITSAWAGVYKHRFPNAMADGEKYESEDVLEIVRLDAETAYVRAELNFYNGHTCSFYGVARVEGDTLVHRERQPPSWRGQCVLTLTSANGHMRFGDAGDECRRELCGARGTFVGQSLPVSSQRRIRYMDRLLASQEFAEAMREAGREP